MSIFTGTMTKAALDNLVKPDAPKRLIIEPSPAQTTSFDLRGTLPEGARRFAVTTGSTVRFFRTWTCRSELTITAEYVFSKFVKGSQVVPAGTLCLREQVGDTKKLLGFQFPQEFDTYFGSDHGVVEKIIEEPLASMRLYAQEMQRCMWCGKSLTDENSRKFCVGPECWDTKHIPLVDRLIATQQWDRLKAFLGR